MALIINDRVQETCSSPGTGTVTLLGASTGFQAFSAGIGDGNTTYYTIADQIGSRWEVGIGTYTLSGNTLARTTVLSSSNAGALVNFNSGTQNIWSDYPASRAVNLNTLGNNIEVVNNQFPAIKPSLLLDFANTKTLDPRITFTRASTGTYYDGSTVIAEQNLLTYSQDFTNAAWTKNGVSAAAGATAPDGTATGITITASGTNLNAIFQSVSIAASPASVTFSIYAKAGTKSVLQIDSAGIGGGRANFDLSAGVLGAYDAGIWTPTIVAVAGGWYRCSATCVGNGSTGNAIFSMQDSTSAAREATSTAGTILLWGAQVENRSTATVYTATTTSAITNYIPVLKTAAANVPRFDVNPTTEESLGLLMEEQRTNLLTYSSDLSNAAWLKFSASITTAAGVAPDGTLTAQNLVENTTASAPHWTGNYSGPTITSGVVYTVSFYAKAAGRNYISLQGDVQSGKLGFYAVQWSLVDGSVAKNTGSFAVSSTNVGNGWWRFTLTATANASGTAYPGLYLGSQVASSSNGVDTYTGNGYSGVLIWGVQFEAGAFATSYIPTVASQVTRSADSAVMTGVNFNSWWNSQQGTFTAEAAAEFTAAQNVTTRQLIQGIGSTSYFLYTNANDAFINSYDGTNAAEAAVSSFTAINKFASSYSGSALSKSLCVNGATVVSSAYNNTFGALTGINIAPSTGFWIKRLSYYNSSLTSAQIQALTTI